MTTKTDPNTIPDEVADAAQIEHYEFVFGWDAEPLTPRSLGTARQAWKCAIAAALDKKAEVDAIPKTPGRMIDTYSEDDLRRAFNLPVDTAPDTDYTEGNNETTEV